MEHRTIDRKKESDSSQTIDKKTTDIREKSKYERQEGINKREFPCAVL